MNEIGKVARHEFEMVFGQEVEVQARRLENGFRPEWSFDGEKWNSLLKLSTSADDAILKARCGAFIAHIHQNVLNRRKDE